MSNSAINGNHREAWIDCARGIAILLVIVGHTISGVLSGAIYSFHMPLFFIFSGITSKFSSTNEEFATKTKRSFKRLMGPFFLSYIIQTVIYLLRHLSNIFQDGSFLTNYLEQRILSGIFSSGVSISVLNATVLYVGVIWFFPAIFLGKSLFDYLHLKLTNRQIQPLPFSFDIVLAILPLFYVGSHFDRFQVKESPFKKFFLYSFLWGLFLIITYAAAPELSTGRVKCIFIPTPVVLYGCTTYEIKIPRRSPPGILFFQNNATKQVKTCFASFPLLSRQSPRSRASANFGSLFA